MSAKSRTPIRKKCPLCQRRVPYLLDSIVNGKRFVRCAKCEEGRVKEEEDKTHAIVGQLSMDRCEAEKSMGPDSLHICWSVEDHSGQHKCSCGYQWGARSDGN